MSREPEYILMNPKKMSEVVRLQRTERTILAIMIKHSANNAAVGGCVVILNPAIRKEMKEVCEAQSKQTISNAISKLHKSGIINKISTGVYQLNPEIFIRKGGHR